MTAGLVSGGFAQEVFYDHPTGLRYLGTIENPDPKPVCNYTTNNPMNDGAFLWAPVGSTVKYTDASSGAPTGYSWTATGGSIADATAKDALVTYGEKGVYDFPTLDVQYADGQKSYTPDLKLKIGGTAELCLADCREWLFTYAWGCQEYPAGQGSLGGTNTLDIAGVGNLYMTAIEDGFLDGVNVYLPGKPTKWKEGAAIRIRVWMPQIGDQLVLTSIPIDGDIIPFENIKGEEDGVYVPVGEGAVVGFKLANPIDLYGKTFLFIDVDGWSNDPETEDFKMLMDVMPNQQMRPEDAGNMLAHNSFARLKGESDYLRPVSYYGGNYGSFMICPVVRGAETPQSALRSVLADNDGNFTCNVGMGLVTFEGVDGRIDIYNMSGQLCGSCVATAGSAIMNAYDFNPGIYVARSAAGKVVKFVVK